MLLHRNRAATLMIFAISPYAMKSIDLLTLLILTLFGLLLWQMHQQDWGSFLLLLAAEAGLIAIKVTSTTQSKRI